MLTRVCLIKYVGFKLHLPRDASPTAAAAFQVSAPAAQLPQLFTRQEGQCLGALTGGQGTWGQSEFTFNDLASGLRVNIIIIVGYHF